MGEPLWIPAEITQITGPRSYSVQTEDGVLWSRHIDQLRSRLPQEHCNCSSLVPIPNTSSRGEGEDHECNEQARINPMCNELTRQEPSQNLSQYQQPFSQMEDCTSLPDLGADIGWALWFFKNDKSKTWQDNLQLVTKFDTVEDFWPTKFDASSVGNSNSSLLVNCSILCNTGTQ
uniref:Uncharacterized protein n=1 Tax=Naja naja TaxID=35670 RepID=A0A8C6YBB6_NAJNA